MFNQLFKYIDRGYAIFPVYTIIQGKCNCGDPDCKSKGKHPKIGTGPSSATKDIKEVKSMSELWLDANIGIATGKISDVVVLDVDPRDSGHEFLKLFEARFKKLPPTITTISGGDGLHYYFKYPDFDIPSRNHLRSGLDFKSNDDWIIAPFSTHLSGKTYKWKVGYSPDNISAASLPEWLANLVLAR